MVRKVLVFFTIISLVFYSFSITALAGPNNANGYYNDVDMIAASDIGVTSVTGEPSGYVHENPNYDMIKYSELKGWLDDITQRSNRVKYSVIGKSAEGRDLYQVIVAEPSAHGKYGKYKGLRNVMMKDPTKAQEMIAADPDYKVPVFINNSIHGGETTGVDASVKLIEELALTDSDEVQKILENTIVVINLAANPDGRDEGWRQNGNGFDCNRDMITQSQPETRAIVEMITEWKPMVTLDNHGYVDPILIEPCSMPHNPNFEEDLYQKWALDVALAMESRLTAEMPKIYPRAEIPFRDYNDKGGWDDYPVIFIPQFAQHYGLTTHTIEVGPRTYDGVLGHYWTSKATLLYAADNREAMFRDQIETFRRGTNYGGPNGNEFPKAYIIPADKPLQANPLETARTIDFILNTGVEVQAATQAFELNGITYPEGTYIVPMNQPLAGLANNILWEGQDISVDPGLPMYDISAWNIPELWGVSRVIVEEDLAVKKAPVNSAVRIRGSISNESSPYFYLSSDSNDAIKAVNKLLDMGVTVLQTQMKQDDAVAGTYIIKNEGAALDTIRAMASDMGLSFEGFNAEPKDAKTLKKLKIAALTTYNGNRASAYSSGTSKLYRIGAMAFVLKELGFDVDVLWPRDVDRKGLDGYDVLVGLENARKTNFSGAGWEKLQAFFQNGGKYVGYGIGGAQFGDSLDILKSSTGISRDSNGIVNLIYDTDNAITGSYPSAGKGFVYDPVYFSGFDSNVKVLAKYDAENMFMAGYWPGSRDAFYGKAAIIANDKAVLFGTDPIFRAHIKDSFRAVANAIYSLTSK